MRWSYRLPLRLRSLLTRRRVERELTDEFRFHLERQIAQYVAQGMTPEEARYAALRELGGVEQIKEQCRDMRRVNFVEDMLADGRYGLRQLRRSPAFAAIVVLLLALGIGANTAIFTVIDAVLLRSLPVRNPGELVLLFDGPTTGSNSGSPLVGRWPLISWDAYRYFVGQNQCFQGIAAFRNGRDPLEVRWPGAASNGQSERAVGQLVSGKLFQSDGCGRCLGKGVRCGRCSPCGGNQPRSSAHAQRCITHC